MNEYIEMWKHYADFSGKTTVKGYWMAVLINFLVALAITLLVRAVNSLAILSTIYSLAVLVPGLAIEVRRLNDAGKHWANIFWPLLPIVGIIVWIVKMCAPSQNPVNA